ncbi:MAG TPA: LysR family transcriptional regulator, partial [Holophagaceae bacterium]|nr:LysR family transcriptional regulator [Holophagaceae bacterium]
MDFSELEVVVCLAQELNFSRAAERLRCSQPTVSQTLRRLEEELGEPLFERGTRNGAPTAMGKVLLNYARSILRLRDEALAATEDLKARRRGHLRLVATECICTYVLPELLLKYRKAHPAIKVELVRMKTEAIPRAVLEQEADFGFLSDDPERQELASVHLRQDELILVASPGHPVARRRGVTVPELGGHGILGFGNRHPARARLAALFAAHRTPLNIVMELASIETLKDFVRQGEGLAFLPRLA